MNVLNENIDLIRDTVLENNSGFIELKSLAARVHLKLPSNISSKCSRKDVSDFIMTNCFVWGISVQDGHRLIMTDKNSPASGVGSILVKCEGEEISVVGGYVKIDSVIDECGFATVYDVKSGNTVIVTRDHKGNLIRSEGNYWPDCEKEMDLYDY